MPSIIPAHLHDMIPGLYVTEATPDIYRIVHLHYFSNRSRLEWFVLEHDAETGTCFGLVNSFELQLREFTLHDLPHVERDLAWMPRSLATVRAELNKERAR